MSAQADRGDRADDLLVIKGLDVDFWSNGSWANVVDCVSFAVRRGESFGLVGESGSGKTTTALAVLGYRRPNSRIRSGSIHFESFNVLALPVGKLRHLRGRRISVVPQDPTTALNPALRVGDQIAEQMKVHGLGSEGSERLARVERLLEQVHLGSTVPKKYPHQLSGGQQQRVVIAMALACKPDLVVLDEPTTGLDVTTQARILELLRELRSELGMALLYVTHNLGVVASICDRVGVMYAGALVEIAPTTELFARPRHPYTQGLIASVPTLSRRARPRLRGVLRREELPPGCRFAPRCDAALPPCVEEPQLLEPVVTGHLVACWRWPDLSPALNNSQEEGADELVPAVRPGGVPLLEVTELTCAYDVRRSWPLGQRRPYPVVQNVSFELRPHETLALVGESGSGKSTIARAVGGLLEPIAGRMAFEGKDIRRRAARRPPELRREIQLVLQNPDASLNPRQRVGEIIARPLELFFGVRGDSRRRRMDALMEDVHLDRSFSKRFPLELSGGERQRVAIARALAAEPKLMLCDEILSALDVSVQAGILDLLRSLQDKHGIAFVFISHDLAVVRSIAHRVAVLYRGELCEVGLVDEVYAPPLHPYTRELLLSAPEIVPQGEPHAPIEPSPRPASLPRLSADATRTHVGCPFADRCPFKIAPLCDDVPPPWVQASVTHNIRCHLPLSELRELEIPSDMTESARAANSTSISDAAIPVPANDPCSAVDVSEGGGRSRPRKEGPAG